MKKLLLVLLVGLMLMPRAQVWATDPACLESTGIIDFEKGTAYITISLPTANELQTVTDLMQRKEAWSCRYPEKRLLAMTIVYGNDYNGKLLIKGLLIHYEWK